MVESFLVALVGFIDTIMVSTLGSYAIAAVGLTQQPKFIGLALFMSMSTAISALVARRRGEQNRESAVRILKTCILVAVILTAIISVTFTAFADPIIRFAGSADDTHEAAVEYFQIIMGGIGFTTVMMIVNAAQRGAGNTKIALRTNMVSNLVNVVFNYLLIGGNFGFPALGTRGAALATVIAREHEGTALCLAVTTDGSKILHRVGIQKFYDFIHDKYLRNLFFLLML